MDKYLDGSELIGDNFSSSEIKEWYDDEKEGYADLGSKNREEYVYMYDRLNTMHGFSHLPKDKKFDHVLGIGSAYGLEFKPVADRINLITIVEPSDNLVSDEIFGIKPTYVKPAENGKLPFPDNHFDLITSFGSLHHIPNVSFVLDEIIRVLQPGGYYLLREPIVSMGDWRVPRVGLTKRERGIPVKFFDQAIKRNYVSIINQAYCFCMTSFIQSKMGRFFSSRLISYYWYVLIDRWLAYLLKPNISYHQVKFFKKIAPQCVFYVLKK